MDSLQEIKIGIADRFIGSKQEHAALADWIEAGHNESAWQREEDQRRDQHRAEAEAELARIRQHTEAAKYGCLIDYNLAAWLANGKKPVDETGMNWELTELINALSSRGVNSDDIELIRSAMAATEITQDG